MTYPVEYHIGFMDALVFLGVGFGLMLSWFFIRSSRQNGANLFQGLFLLSLSLAVFESLLNSTGYIVKFLALSNFAEPLNYTFGPLFYLYIKRSVKIRLSRKEWWHFLLACFWLLYCIFHFVQPDAFKYNSFLYSNHPDWEPLTVNTVFPEDPLRIRPYTNLILAVQFLLYGIVSFLFLMKHCRRTGESIRNPENTLIRRLRNMMIHVSMIILIFVFVKLYFGRDLGDLFIAAYISLMILTTSYGVMRNSSFFTESHSILDLPAIKYQKSSLTDEFKEAIVVKIEREMAENRYFANNMASVAGLAKRIHESSHHVSQVINEQLQKNFFELLAWYRVEEAKKVLARESESGITIEELAEQVGYNSKTAFNNAFKKLTGKTPSEYRKTVSN